MTAADMRLTDSMQASHRMLLISEELEEGGNIGPSLPLQSCLDSNLSQDRKSCVLAAEKLARSIRITQLLTTMGTI